MASKRTVKECYDILNLSYPQHYRHLEHHEVLTVLRLWEHDFRRFSDDTLKKAVTDARRECRYFPTVAELIEHCRTYDDGYENLWDAFRERDTGETMPNEWSVYVDAGENTAP